MRNLSGTNEQESMPLQLGRPVWCSDGPVGRLSDVVVDPQERRLTHLVVEDNDGEARLVPVGLIVGRRDSGHSVLLSCSSADVAAFEAIRSFSVVGLEEFPAPDERTDIGVEEVMALPSLGAAEFGDYAGDLAGGYGITYDRIPSSSAELRRGSTVVSVDGDEIGNVEGFLLVGERLTHVVLQHARLSHLGAAAIPIESVASIETDRITVTLPLA